jgi:predicted transcriptional regulator
MYNANLNYGQLRSQLDTLSAQGLLEKRLNKFVMTERGLRFLELFVQLNDLLEVSSP